MASLKRYFFALSFKVHLLLIVVLLSLPAVALIVYSGMEQRNDALNDGISDTKVLVHSIVTEQYNLTGDAAQLASVLAALPSVRQHDAPEVGKILRNVMRLNRQYANILIADRFGAVWASALPLTKTVSVGNNLSFKQTVASGRFSSGEYGIGSISGKPNIGFGYPVFGANGELDGVIIASVDFDYLNQLLLESGLPKGGRFVLTDRNGTVVYGNLNPRPAIGQRLPDPLFLPMQKGEEAVSFLDFGSGPGRMINSFGKLRLRGESAPYLYVLAGIPLHETLMKAKRAEAVHVALLSPFLLLAVGLAVLIGKHCFMDQIRTLEDASRRLAQGDLKVRVAERLGGGEIGALGRSFDEMARQLAARNAELNELNRSLALRVEAETERRLQQERLLARHARLAAIGEMIGAIAHQWRQPLATLGATIQGIRMAWERRLLDGPFLKRAEADAQKQLYYMSDTIEDFRNFFSPDKVEDQFDVREKVDEVILLVSAQFGNAQVALAKEDLTPQAKLKVTGYQNEFKQSILNLVSNAFDAVQIAKGGGAQAEGGGEVRILLSRAGEKVLVEVIDNGCGIPPEHADKVYEPYFTSKPEGKGTGIGLYMSKLIVEESMGGSLSFTSGAGGTCFRIELAAHRGEA